MFLGSPIYNQKQTHISKIILAYKDFENEIKELADSVFGEAIYFARESNSKLDNETNKVIQIDSEEASNSLNYSIYLRDIQSDIPYSTKSITVTFAYFNYFMVVKNITPGQYSIKLSDEMPADAVIYSINRKYDKTNNLDSFEVVINFASPFTIESAIKLLDIEFLTYFPAYSEDEVGKPLKSNTIIITHNIISNDNCIDYINPEPVNVTRQPICLDSLRQIVISPVDYSLGKIAPNPYSNRILHIDFSIGLSGYTEISLISSIGIEQKKIVSSYLKSGKYEIDYLIGDLPSGMYILQIRSGEYNESEKVIFSF
jgi:hypothetical protein